MHSLHFSSGAKTPLGNKGPLLSGAQSPDDIYVDENAQLFSEPEDKGNYTRIFGLFLLMAAWTLVLTFVPVFVDVGPYDIYEPRTNWYTGDDVIRFIEPVGGLMIHLNILWESGVLSAPRTAGVVACVCIWAFAAAVYEQGAGFHSAACMFKNAMKSIPEANQDDIYDDIYWYMKTLWEHLIGHYLYASGYAVMCVCYAWAYRNHTIGGRLGCTPLSLLLSAALLNGIVIAGVAIDFPSGCLVALLYLCLYGIGALGLYCVSLYRSGGDKNIFHFGRRPVIHYYILSYIIALFLIVLWIIIVGGMKTRSQAGY